ncbi:CRISPR-associated protein TM1812 [Hydrogenimonas sp.]|nr:CRISPR-associated protein TM1812 [Hydrogenimonas sp.]
MDRVLISSVGTGDIKKDSRGSYEETLYVLDGKEYRESLTSKVIISHYHIERMILIGTVKSMWDSFYVEYGGEDDEYLSLLERRKEDGSLREEDLEKLQELLNSYLGSEGSRCILIDYTRNDSEEMWENFEKLLEIRSRLDGGDRVILDITHGFRYIPILNIFLLEVLRSMDKEKFEIEAILYGMFGDNRSDIIDFKIFFDLLDWIKALNAFKEYSNADQLSLLLEKESSAKDAHRVFSQFSKNLQMANIHALWRFAKGISKKIAAIERSDNKVLKLLSEDFSDIAKRLDKETQSAFQYELAVWLYESKNYALSYIVLYEAIITKVCEQMGYDLHNHEEREEAKKHVDAPFNRFFNTKFPDSISVIRNCIVHQCEERRDMVEQDIKRLKKFLDEFRIFIER